MAILWVRSRDTLEISFYISVPPPYVIYGCFTDGLSVIKEKDILQRNISHLGVVGVETEKWDDRGGRG